MNGIDQIEEPLYDVVVIGLGPAGATLASLLGLCGLSTLVLEREAETFHLPRAVGFDDEAMRVFQTIGLADEIASTTRLNPGMRFVDTGGEQILIWPRPAVIGPNGWYSAYRFHQPELEALLRRGLARFPSVEVRTRADVFAFDEEAEWVRVRYEDLDSGRLASSRGRYVVGCDGARSLVRRFVGSSMDDLGFHERWLIVDVVLKTPKPELGDYTVQFCDPHRPATYVRGLGDRRRWEITVRPEEDSREMVRPDAVWGVLSPWLGRDEAELERATVYTFHSAVAQVWRHDRLLLAGDAAHQTPPFLGQGMCAGIRDAANLAWKLERVIRGKAPDTLLDTYESERSPNVREYIRTAVRLGGLINTRDPEAALTAAFRDADGSAFIETIQPRLGPGCFADRGDLRGRPAAQPRLGDGRLLDDHVGYAFVLLANDGFWRGVPPDIRDAFVGDGVSVVTDAGNPELAAWLEQVNAEAVLVRPDRYVAGTAGAVSDLRDLSGVLASQNPRSRAAGVKETI